MAGMSEKALRATLNLPNTRFPMRANALKREPSITPRITTQLYQRQRVARAGCEPWTILDGPPYANGNLHMGHLLNKVLKDFFNRAALLRGQQVLYVPGWDCHGLPIELKAVQSLPGQARAQPLEIRQAARAWASSAVESQAADFERWGVCADWEAPRGAKYLTMSPAYEAEQLRMFADMVEAGHIQRGLKPVYWSPASRTALAEAELEYVDDHVSTAAYVGFPLAADQPTAAAQQLAEQLRAAVSGALLGGGDHAALPEVLALTWTTTPWTLPANVAMSVSDSAEYSLVEAHSQAGARQFVMLARELAAACAEALQWSDWRVLRSWQGSELVSLAWQHPLAQVVPECARPSLSIASGHVTMDVGTGLVHTASSHGHDDWAAVASAKEQHPWAADIPALHLFDDSGVFTDAAGEELQGAGILTDANARVLAAFERTPYLLHQAPYSHRYPYDWRSKTPVIIRATSQWFCNVASVGEQAARMVEAGAPSSAEYSTADRAHKVAMYPEAGRVRLAGMLRGRTEWCISRQRHWGVPIPTWVHKETGEALPLSPRAIRELADAVAQHPRGCDVWWEHDAASTTVDPLFPAELGGAGSASQYVRATDTLDVWFDSGTAWQASWAQVCGEAEPAAASPEQAASQPALAHVLTRQGVEPAVAASVAAAVCAQPDSASQHAGSRPRTLDMVLEGSDQHRGWFQSSLLTSTAMHGAAPFERIVTHGFVLDGEGRKMSKSLGNVTEPRDVIQGKAGYKSPYGVDVARLWALSSDHSRDVVVSPVVVAKASDALRKWRNTARFLLGNMADYMPAGAPEVFAQACEAGLSTEAAATAAVTEAWSSCGRQPGSWASTGCSPVDMYLMWRLRALHAEVQAGVAACNSTRAIAAVNKFTTQDVSARWAEWSKDRLYSSAAADGGRIAAQAAAWQGVKGLVTAMAPSVPHTAEDVWLHVAANLRCLLEPGYEHPEDAAASPAVTCSVFDTVYVPPSSEWTPSDQVAKWTALLALRNVALAGLEQARGAGDLGSALGAELHLRVPEGSVVADAVAWLQAHAQLEDVFGVSAVQVSTYDAHGAGTSAAAAIEAVRVAAEPGHAWAFAAQGSAPGSIVVEDTDVRAPSLWQDVSVTVTAAPGDKCARCWKVLPCSGSEPCLCERCEAVLHGLRE